MNDTQKPEQEPAAYFVKSGTYQQVDAVHKNDDDVFPLYTAPQNITPPDEWDEAVDCAKYVKTNPLTRCNFLPEMAQAILDMDAKMKGLK